MRNVDTAAWRRYITFSMRAEWSKARSRPRPTRSDDDVDDRQLYTSVYDLEHRQPSCLHAVDVYA